MNQVFGNVAISLDFCVSRHHDNTAADRFAADMAAHALESPDEEPERVLVIVTSQYAWEVS